MQMNRLILTLPACERCKAALKIVLEWLGTNENSTEICSFKRCANMQVMSPCCLKSFRLGEGIKLYKGFLEINLPTVTNKKIQ